jgi:hypothetical protein
VVRVISSLAVGSTPHPSPVERRRRGGGEEEERRRRGGWWKRE